MLHQDVLSLIERVREGDWPLAFRSELLAALLNLEDRIRRFRIFGAEGVAIASARIVGTLTMNESVAKSNPGLAKEAAEVLRLNPNFSLEVHKQRMPIKDPAVLERHIAALRKAGLK